MDDVALAEALRTAQRLGAVGRGRAVEDVIAHARGFVAALEVLPAGCTVVDLGSGGGVPGLVIAVDRPDLHVLLVDRRRARVDLLQRLVHRLRVAGGVDVRCADARRLTGERWWVPADAVVARGFGPLAVTLAVARPLLGAGGMVVVSEPPCRSAQPGSAPVAGRGLRRRAFQSPPGTGRVAVFAAAPVSRET